MFTLKHPVRSGCTTTGTVCFRSQNEWLIRLDSGRRLNVFFPDGHVYVCTQRGMNFTEISLCPYEALKVRIEDAESRLRAAHNEGSRPAALSLIVREMEQLYQVILPSEIETESCRNLLVERFFSRLTLRERELMSPQARRSIIASLLRWEGFRGIAQSFNE
jgi:prepilin-type processing-associated H-X9-DG protein